MNSTETAPTLADLAAAYDAASLAFDRATLANMHLPTDATRKRYADALAAKNDAATSLVMAQRVAS